MRLTCLKMVRIYEDENVSKNQKRKKRTREEKGRQDKRRARKSTEDKGGQGKGRQEKGGQESHIEEKERIGGAEINIHANCSCNTHRFRSPYQARI